MAGMHRRPVLTLILLSSLTFFLGLGRQAITDMDEAYYAEAAREMVETGDWLTPHFNYEHRWEKPVLYYWLTSAVYVVAGPSEAAARFWSALAGVGLVLLTFAIAREEEAALAVRSSPPASEGPWLAGAIAATCFGYFAEARLALPDLPLTFLITLTIWTALRQCWALAGLAAGLGFLMKGPVAFVVPALVILPIWWREGTWRVIRWRGVALGCAIALAVGVPWYVAMTVTHGRAYLESFFISDNLERFATNKFTGKTTTGLFFYIPIVLAGLVPWTVYAVVMLVARLARRENGSSRWQGNASEWRLGLWTLVPLLFFTISFGKQPRYILPVLPPVAILLGSALSRRIASPNRRQPALAAGTVLTGVLFATAALLLQRARPLFINSYAIVTSFGIAALVGWSLALLVAAARSQWSRLRGLMPLAAATLLLTLQFGAQAGVRPEPVEKMAKLVGAYRVSNEPVGEYDVFDRNMVFYSRFKQVRDLDQDGAAQFLRSPGRVFLFLSETNANNLRQNGLPARELGRIDYLDTGKVAKLRTLLWPDPQKDIETVLLVTNQ
jgi:4-amino-4-deoxy-L-arabinose transferase-like glycosyltransferase